MGRSTYNISDENRRRLELLIAFSIIDGKEPRMQDLINLSIQDFFVHAYRKYCEQSPENDLLRNAMERMLPDGYMPERSFLSCCRSV